MSQVSTWLICMSKHMRCPQHGISFEICGAGDVFSDHLRAVQDVIRSYNVESPVVSAGLLHSIYGTEGFQDFQLSLDRREDVKQVIYMHMELLMHETMQPGLSSEVSPCCSLSASGQSSLHVSASSVIPGASTEAGTCGSCLHGALLHHLVCLPCRRICCTALQIPTGEC